MNKKPNLIKITFIHKFSFFKRKVILLIIFTLFFIYKFDEKYSLITYKNYINDCFIFKKYKKKTIKNNEPFVSICLPIYNMEKYIEKSVLSILNQSFQDFEIILVDDFSNDNTKNILNKLKINNKIKIINHYKNLGIYASRIDGILNSRGKYIISMDPDDMLLHPNLLNKLYKYIKKYNLDIIEYTVFHYNENKEKLFKNHKKSHYHNFRKQIIFQPELSDLFFYKPRTNNYSSVICQVIWNKIIRKEIYLKSINYIGIDYYKQIILQAEDTLINIVNLQFANNYSNINYPGYMHNIRKISTTHGKKNIKKGIINYYSYFLYNKKLYTLIKDFNKDRNFLFYDLKRTNYLLLNLINIDNSKKIEIIKFYKEIIEDKKISKILNEYILENIKIINKQIYKIKRKLFL